MTDLTDKEINEQIETAYETLRTVVEHNWGKRCVSVDGARTKTEETAPGSPRPRTEAFLEGDVIDPPRDRVLRSATDYRQWQYRFRLGRVVGTKRFGQTRWASLREYTVVSRSEIAKRP
jgi:hypothetical protein